MDTLTQHVSGLASLLCAAALAFVVLTRRVQEGVVIKMGLVMMIGGLLATGVISLKGFDSLRGFWNAGLLIRVGLLVVILGYVRRVDAEMKEIGK